MASPSYSQVATTDLEETLVQGPPSERLTASAVTKVTVTAPATLPEGYEFDAVVGSHTFKVQVPPGGIEEGQRFEVPLPHHFETHLTGIQVPVGHWRDGLGSIFKYGACHPHCWTACFCHLLAAGQVIRRMKLNWLGQPAAGPGEAAVAFKIIFALVCLYFCLYVILNVWIVYLDPNTYAPPGSDLPPTPFENVLLAFLGIFRYIYWITTTVVLMNLRKHLRQVYAIPASTDLEDCCCSCWCPCFVAGQMLRHTTDYDVYPATCCTETGIPPHAPSIV